MASAIVTADSVEATRTELARLAICEANFLLATLDREFRLAKTDADADIGLEATWPLYTRRLADLNRVVLSVLADEMEKTETLHALVHHGEGAVAD